MGAPFLFLRRGVRGWRGTRGERGARGVLGVRGVLGLGDAGGGEAKIEIGGKPSSPSPFSCPPVDAAGGKTRGVKLDAYSDKWGGEGE
jgi:hypothetical protein